MRKFERTFLHELIKLTHQELSINMTDIAHTAMGNHRNHRRLLCVPPPTDAPLLPVDKLYRANNPQVSVSQSVGYSQNVNIRWGNVGYSNQREPAYLRAIKRSDGELLSKGTLALVRGRVVGRNFEDLEGAVDNIAIEPNDKYLADPEVHGDESFYRKLMVAPQYYVYEYDLSNFVVPANCRLQLIRHCDVFVGEQMIFANVDVQFVVNEFELVVFGDCRVYVDRGTPIDKRMVTLKWTDPQTQEAKLWEITNLTLTYGYRALNRSSKQAICPYCAHVTTFHCRSLRYRAHLLREHGIFADGTLVPDPIRINGRKSCPICLETVKLGHAQRFKTAYLEHFAALGNLHKILHVHWSGGHKPLGLGAVRVIDLVVVFLGNGRSIERVREVYTV